MLEEHLLPGNIGKALIYLSFATAIISAIYFYLIHKKGDKNPKLKKMASMFFNLHLFSLVGASIVLFYVILNHYFEYNYVWQHSSMALELKYAISCFWAGQEGSFLLWALFQAIFGIMVLKQKNKFVNLAMFIVALSQVFLVSMILGLNFGEFNIGLSPFVLIKDMAENLNNPVFHTNEYLGLITDGQGLNPLLQNFWMISHPPLLFLGYASTLIPFAYALSALLNKQVTEWLKIALPWVIISTAFLGIGIILGGAWAYKSLTFGGFWAWDPVENASLIPWLLLIGTIHLMLVSIKTKQSILSSFIFAFLSYFAIIYASFLTRSGILGETSVHAFSNNGLTMQFVIWLATFVLLPLIFIVRERKQMLAPQSESIVSREFWIFMGSIILLLSSFHVLFTTSFPVINKLFGTSLALSLDKVAFYNKWQIPFALVGLIIIGFIQFTRYAKDNVAGILKNSLLSLLSSTLLIVLLAVLYKGFTVAHLMLLFAALFTVISSIDHYFRFAKMPQNIGATTTHIGFGIFVMGVVIPFSQSEIISKNTSDSNAEQVSQDGEFASLTRNVKKQLGTYFVEYTSAVANGNNINYTIDFYKNENSDLVKKFTIHPFIQINSNMGNVYEPDTKHYLTKDIYVFLAHQDYMSNLAPSSGNFDEQHLMSVGDHLDLDGYRIVLKKISQQPEKSKDTLNSEVKVIIDVYDGKGVKYSFIPGFSKENGVFNYKDVASDSLGIQMRLIDFEKSKNQARIQMVSMKPVDRIILKAIIFPFINVLWLGVFLIFAGMSLSFYKRYKRKD